MSFIFTITSTAGSGIAFINTYIVYVNENHFFFFLWFYCVRYTTVYQRYTTVYQNQGFSTCLLLILLYRTLAFVLWQSAQKPKSTHDEWWLRTKAPLRSCFFFVVCLFLFFHSNRNLWSWSFCVHAQIVDYGDEITWQQMRNCHASLQKNWFHEKSMTTTFPYVRVCEFMSEQSCIVYSLVPAGKHDDHGFRFLPSNMYRGACCWMSLVAKNVLVIVHARAKNVPVNVPPVTKCDA